ncbi:MAG: metallophosphoesterase [Kordiimonadaceae bacterium]|nr:metallophosphoesterase [Kordiimonadaceae bacterium]
MERQSTDPFHMHLPANTDGRDFFLGDVHGRLDALLVALGESYFDPTKDRVICVGDLIDRGPNSYEMLKLTRQPWFHSVRGNHEAMLLDAKDQYSLMHWLMNGGNWFPEMAGAAIIDCYSLAINLPVAITLDIEGGKQVGICHAEWPGEDWATITDAVKDKKSVNHMLWGRRVVKNKLAFTDKTAVLTVHGHTPIPHPERLGSALFIDTGCVFGGYLTLIELNDALNWKPTQL